MITTRVKSSRKQSAARAPSGYSATPLPKRLDITDSSQVALIGAPSEYEALLGNLPAGADLGAALWKKTDIAHVFVTRRARDARSGAKKKT